MDLENNNELRQLFLSDEDYAKFCKRYKSDRRVRKSLEKISVYERDKQYIQAMQERRKLEETAKKMIQQYMDENGRRREETEVELCKLGISDTDRELLSANAVSICMCCDIVECFCMSIQEMLRKYGDYELTQFLDIDRLQKEARGRLQWLGANTDLRKYGSWGSACDFYIESIPKRAMKLMKACDAKKQCDRKTEWSNKI